MGEKPVGWFFNTPAHVHLPVPLSRSALPLSAAAPQISFLPAWLAYPDTGNFLGSQRIDLRLPQRSGGRFFLSEAEIAVYIWVDT